MNPPWPARIVNLFALVADRRGFVHALRAADGDTKARGCKAVSRRASPVRSVWPRRACRRVMPDDTSLSGHRPK
ncbi:hypothetical protein DBR21_01135 [Caulobacter sp. HMWF009]|nr:hypothetical protein DBR21_01135 [Caulobacter sp. HMWF009]PTT08364.1 hypothetical protein DBR10_09225 [Caulobacter sp. HMWF025]